MKEFIKLNDEPIEVVYKCDTEGFGYFGFDYDGAEYNLENFIRVHNNMWFNDEGYPDYIHGCDAFDYFNPLYIEVVDGETVNVYNLIREREVV